MKKPPMQKLLVTWRLPVPLINPAINFAGLIIRGGIFSLALAGVPASLAQTSETRIDAVIEEIIVTAERREASVQDTAISIATISGEELMDKGVTTIDGALRDIPAVQLQSDPKGGQVYIRGVGTNGDSNWIDSAVSLMRDNVYSGRSESVTAVMYDVERVEVLRGPQGTLYGRNATGGSVNVITNSPGDEQEFVASLQAGDYNLMHVDAAANLPVSDSLSMRLAALREVRDGYYSNNGNAADATGGRLKLLFTPTEDFSLLASLDHLRMENDGVTTVPRPFTIPRLPNGDIPPPIAWLDDWSTDYDDPWEVDPLHPPQEQDYRFTTASLQADWDLDWGLLTLLPAYNYSERHVFTDLISGIVDVDFDGELNDLQESLYEEEQYSFEARLASPAGSKMEWVVGLYYLHSLNENLLADDADALGAEDRTFSDAGRVEPTTSTAIFGQATWPLTDRLRLTTGLRYTEDEKAQTVDFRSVIGDWDPAAETYSTDSEELTYKLGVEYDVAPESMLYAQIATGYKAGGFATTAFPPNSYDPEYLTAYELGSKNRFLDNRLEINAEAYVYHYEDYQVQYALFDVPNINPDALADVDPSNDTLFQQYVANAGRGDIYGAEVEARWLVTQQDRLNLALTYTHARYGDIEETQISYASGAIVANSAPRTARIGWEHSWALSDVSEIAAGLNVHWSDEYFATLQNDLPGNPNTLQESYTRSDATLNYRPADANWSASAWVRNIEDDAQIVGVLPWGRTLITNPRTFGLSLSMNF